MRAIFDKFRNDDREVSIDFSSYVKNYKGKLWRNNKYVGMWRDGKFTNENINFYDEREWRYIPKIDEKKDRISKYMSIPLTYTCLGAPVGSPL